MLWRCDNDGTFTRLQAPGDESCQRIQQHIFMLVELGDVFIRRNLAPEDWCGSSRLKFRGRALA